MGMTDEGVKVLWSLYQAYLGGDSCKVETGIEDCLGRKPTNVRSFLANHVGHFMKSHWETAGMLTRRDMIEVVDWF